MNTTRYHILLATLIGSLGATPIALSQDKKIDLEARKQSVANLEEHIKDRQDRLADIANEIIRIDARVEKQVDKIVGRLKKMDDTKDSDARVAQTKESAIEGLRKMISYYVRKRDEVRQKLRKDSTIPKETLQGDVKKFDERINKRVGQIIGLSKSFTEAKEIEKYETSTQSNWGWTWTEYGISDDWRHNRKTYRHTKSQKKELVTALEKSIETLKAKKRSLQHKLDTEKLSPGIRQIVEEDLRHSTETLLLREAQLGELMTSSDQPQTKGVDRDEAHSVQLSIKDAAKDLRDDFFSIFTKYAALNAERENIAALEKKLAARKDWLEKNAK